MRKKYFYCFTLILILAGSYNCFAQEKLEGKALQEDIRVIEDLIKGYSLKLSKEEISNLEKLVSKHEKVLANEAFTAMEFFNYLILIDWNTQFDEHASISIGEEVLLPLLESSKLFPIPIKILESKIVVNSEDVEIPFCSILHSINGISFDSLFNKIIGVPMDSFYRRTLERQFSILYLIKKGSINDFTIAYSTINAPDKRVEKTVSGVGFNKYREVFDNVTFPSSKNKLIETAHYPNTHTFMLQLNSFDWGKNEKSGLFGFMTANSKLFDKKFKKIFKEISKKDIQNLVIDLRYNTGGIIEVPGLLYKYIALEAFEEDATLEIKSFDLPHMELIKEISGVPIEKIAQVKGLLSRYEKKFIKSDSTYVWETWQNKITQPAKNAFKGQVYLLVGGKSISSSAYFTALFKSKKRGIIIGDKLGGSHKALTAGQLLTYQLPNSKINITVPLMLLNFSKQLYEQVPEEKIIPESQLSEQEKLNYFINKKDGEFEKVVEMIGELE